MHKMARLVFEAPMTALKFLMGWKVFAGTTGAFFFGHWLQASSSFKPDSWMRHLELRREQLLPGGGTWTVHKASCAHCI